MNEKLRRMKGLLLSRNARTLLMAARCEFIEGQIWLSKKGKGCLSPAQWRLWNRFICWINPRRKAEMLQFLEFHQMQKMRTDLNCRREFRLQRCDRADVM